MSALTRLEIRLSEPEAELALAEVRAVLAAAGSGRVPRRSSTSSSTRSSRACSTSGRRSSLEPILELALQAGRIRAIYGPPGETAALRLYRKLPRGDALRRAPRT